MGLQFFPRGGSAQVARYLLHALDDAGWRTGLAAGSLGRPGEETNARTFFGRPDVHAVDYSPAVAAFEAGSGSFGATDPMHPSYEDRADVADGLLAAVAPNRAAQLAASWTSPFACAGIDQAEVVHLHHLTAQHDVVAQRWAHVPVVVHLHGTELKFLEAVDERVDVARALGHSLATMGWAAAEHRFDVGPLDDRQREILATTRWAEWRHGEHWRARLTNQAQSADHLITVSPPDRITALSLFGVEPSRITAIPNGVETDRFAPRHVDAATRRARFRRWLVEDPQGWDTSNRPGSVAYTEADLDRLLGPDGDHAVMIYVGRFTDAKRVPLLVRAFDSARRRSRRPVSLVVWGGHPGEWEGEHPVDVARAVGDDGIYFTGWRGHHDLPDGLAVSDCLVMPSVNDSFAQTALEAMAVGIPVLATISGGFPSMINLDPAQPTGWLVPPDDLDALAAAMVHLAGHPADVARRGSFALAHARAELSWSGRVPAVEATYARAIERRQRIRIA